VTPNSSHLGKITLQQHVRGISLMHLRYAPGVRLARHAHEKACFVWIQSGAYEEAFGPRVFRLRARQVLFRPAGEEHCDLFFEGETACVIIEVSESWLNLVGDCGRVRSDPFVSTGRQMSRLAADLYVQAQQKDTAAPLALEGLSYALGAELIRESLCEERDYPPRWLRRLHDQLSEDPCGNFTLSDLAASAGVHPVHLSRQFRRYYGEPLWEFLRRRRVEIGAQMILRERGTLCKIAYVLGFSEQAHFTRTFKRFMGVTPSEFRHRQRGARSERRFRGR